jgi:hypothetical protein
MKNWYRLIEYLQRHYNYVHRSNHYADRELTEQIVAAIALLSKLSALHSFGAYIAKKRVGQAIEVFTRTGRVADLFSSLN